MLLVCAEVFKRYILNIPAAWIFDASSMLYGSPFMSCGVYPLAQDGHVRGDFLYSLMRPRTQAALDLALYIVFFLPGIAALAYASWEYAGWEYAGDSWRINEHSNVTADGPPVYHFKTIILIAGTLLLLQGGAEIARCIICLKTGRWPERLEDVNEIDVVKGQSSQSKYVDEESRKRVIESAEDQHRRDEAWLHCRFEKPVGCTRAISIDTHDVVGDLVACRNSSGVGDTTAAPTAAEEPLQEFGHNNYWNRLGLRLLEPGAICSKLLEPTREITADNIKS